MISNLNRLRVTMQQMERLIRALDDLKRDVLPNDPRLFAVMSEAPLDALNRLRNEIAGYVQELSGPAA
ncbi:MAG: hypothetical protein KY476_06305 [Planctomycetes bacterium]|nr:hypothetical protein [Planctomycetota bacterium]